MITIYCVTNLINGKCYVGQTSQNVKRRWSGHLHGANSDKRMPRPAFHSAIRKYGPTAFSRFSIYRCDTKQEADKAESFFIGAFKATDRRYGYNRTSGGEGRSPTAATRLKLRLAHLGRKQSPETIAKRSGKAASLCTRAKMSASHRGFKHSEESKSKMRKYNFSVEHRANLSLAIKGRTLSPEWRRKLSDAHKFSQRALEHARRNAALSRGRKHSPEALEKIRSASFRTWERRKSQITGE